MHTHKAKNKTQNQKTTTEQATQSNIHHISKIGNVRTIDKQKLITLYNKPEIEL